MKLLEGLLPIIEKKEGSRPITFKNKASIQALLNEEARLERLATRSENKDPNYHVLEPIAHTLFDVFDVGTEKESAVDVTTPDFLHLIPVGTLSILSDPEPLDVNRVIPQLDIKAYQERRKIHTELIMFPIRLDTEGDAHMSDAQEEEYLPNTQDVNQMIESILGPDSAMEDVASTTSKVPSLLPTQVLAQPAISSPQPAIPSPQPITVVTQPVTIQPEEPVSQPTPPAQREATVTVVEPSSNEQTQAVTVSADRSNARWYADDTITTDDIASSEQIYVYGKDMIPIFATLNQQDQCEKTTRASQVTTSSSNFDKPISILNFSSSLDLAVDEQWNQSGKLMFLKSLLEGLFGKDLILLLIVNDLGEEEALVSLIGDHFKLDCVRLNYMLDEDWNGEYGVFVKTMVKVNQSKGLAKRGNKFTRAADFIVCMDVRVTRDNELFSKIIRRDDSSEKPPIAWLVTLGSVEERIFKHLKENNAKYSKIKTIAFKELLRIADDWPVDESSSTGKLNKTVAENVQSWLLTAGKDRPSYQYRSTLRLPKAVPYAYVKPTQPVENIKTVTPVIEEDATSDMDIASDSEEAAEAEPEAVEEEPVRELSKNLNTYINEVLFPPFDTKKGHLAKANTSAVKLSGKEHAYMTNHVAKKKHVFIISFY